MGEQNRVVLWIPTELRERLEALAAERDVSLSQVVCTIIHSDMHARDRACFWPQSAGTPAGLQPQADINPSELSDAELDQMLGHQKLRMERWRKLCATEHPDPIKQQMCEADAQLFEKLDWELTKRRTLFGYRERARHDQQNDAGGFLRV